MAYDFKRAIEILIYMILIASQLAYYILIFNLMKLMKPKRTLQIRQITFNLNYFIHLLNTKTQCQ